MKDTDNLQALAYARAKKRVKDIREFYHHLFFYLLFNVPLLLFAKPIAQFLKATTYNNDEFAEWVELNMYITPFFWGIGLIFHGIYTFIFKGSVLKKWEDRQMKKYLDQE